MCQNTTMWVNGAWIKRYCVLCSKTYNTLHSCHNFPAGSRQAARGARICETSVLRFHYDPCVTATLIIRPHSAQNTHSLRSSATISDQNAILQRYYYDPGDRTTLLGRPRCVCCAHTGVCTTILRRPSLFRWIYGSIARQARMFRTHFFKMQMRCFISWKRTISFKFESLVFK